MAKVIRTAVSVLLLLTSLAIFASAFVVSPSAATGQETSTTTDLADLSTTGGQRSGQANTVPESTNASARDNYRSGDRGIRLVASLTVFLLSVFVGFEVITKVPPTLHTPLMSGSNAISGITIVGALLTAGHVRGGFGAFLGMVAILLAFINVMGGFLVTHRMLMMFKKR